MRNWRSGLPDPTDRTAAWHGEEPAYVAWVKALSDEHEEAERRGEYHSVVSEVQAVGLLRHYGEGPVTRRCLERIAAHGPLHEYGAGLGYVARLLSDIGADIVASDPDPTGSATGHGGGEPWFQLRQGGYGDSELDGRTPLLVWPFQNAPHAWLAQPRRPPRLIIVDGRPDPYHASNHVARSLIEFYEVLEEWSANAGWRQTPDFIRVWTRR